MVLWRKAAFSVIFPILTPSSGVLVGLNTVLWIPPTLISLCVLPLEWHILITITGMIQLTQKGALVLCATITLRA